MNKIIVIDNISDKILDKSVYEFIELCRKANKRFVVSHLENNEFANLEKRIEEEGSISKVISFRWMCTLDVNNGYVKFADYDDYDAIGSYILKDNKLEYNINTPPFVVEPWAAKYTLGYKVYTTETYDDMLEHYKLENINKIEKYNKR